MNTRMSGDPPAPRKLNPQLSPQAEEIVLRALQRDPSRRYPTAAAMKADLDAPDQMRVMTELCDRFDEGVDAMEKGAAPGATSFLHSS